jgi:hypothetical protein
MKDGGRFSYYHINDNQGFTGSKDVMHDDTKKVHKFDLMIYRKLTCTGWSNDE